MGVRFTDVISWVNALSSSAPRLFSCAKSGLKRLSAVAMLLMITQASTVTQAGTGQKAQRAHAQGSCGSMGPGTGLSGNKGWVVSMIPGKHQFRVRGGVGQVYVTAARQSVVDFDIGRPYYVVAEGSGLSPVLEWKAPGSDWEVISNYFLYPISN